jgi:GntR family transcriptional regulator
MTLGLKIDRDSKIPYYHQLYLDIAHSIENNIFAEGEKLPNETKFCEDLNISRITVRQALRELEKNGYIVRERGRGTFVRKKIETRALQKVSCVIDELKEKGIETKKEVLENAVIAPDKRIREILNLPVDDNIIFIKRLVYAYDLPLYVTKAYIPYSLTGKIDDKPLSEDSFTKILTQDYNLRLINSKRILEPEIPDEEITRLLGLEESEKKVIHYSQTFWTVLHDSEGKIIYFEEFFNSAKGKFIFEKDYE